MTEAEWLACTEPEPMLRWLLDRAVPRKLRLFACACCRSAWHLLGSRKSRGGVQLAERFADGQASQSELVAAWREASSYRRRAGCSCDGWGASRWARQDAAEAAEYACCDDASQAALSSWWMALHAEGHEAVALSGEGPSSPTEYGRGATYAGATLAAKRVHRSLLEEIFGNPFRPVSFDPVWRTANVLALTQAIYEERELPSGVPHEKWTGG